MAFESEFLGMMPHTVMHSALQRDEQGHPVRNLTGHESHTEPAEVQCLIEEKVRRIRTSEGETVISASRFYCGPAPVIQVDDKVVMPNGSSPEIVAVDRYADEDGPHNQVVHLA